MEMPAPGWHSDPQVAMVVSLETQGTPRGRARARQLGRAVLALIPIQLLKSQEFGFGLVFTPMLLIQTGFAHPETPGLGRARAALLTVVQQNVLDLV